MKIVKEFILYKLSILTILMLYAIQASAFADSTLIKKHLLALTKTPDFRSHRNIEQLNETAAYINSVFSSYTKNVSVQDFVVNGNVYKNVIASFGPENTQRIIVGAHYDICGQQQGADDNATGVTGLLELARMLKGQTLKYRIDLVAYSLEEPPYFRTENMGSYVHAKSLINAKAKIYGMVALEMIGYFSDKKNSQQYPDERMVATYGTTGDYITLVKTLEPQPFTDAFCKAFKASKTIKTEIFSGPPSLPGIDFSDHLNYWKFGFNALMITDTAFYRNKNYHTASDTLETLDLRRMAKVIDGAYKALIAL